MGRRPNATLALLGVVLIAATGFAATADPGLGAIAGRTTAPAGDDAGVDRGVDATTERTTAATSEATSATTTTTVGTTPPRELETVVVARYPAANGSMVEERVLDASTVGRVAPPTYDSRTDTWRVPVTLTDRGAASFSRTLVDAGFTTDGVGACPTTDARNGRGHCLLLVVDDDVATAFAVGERFATAVESGGFEANPRFALVVSNETDAKRVWRGLLDDDASARTTSASADSTTVTGTATASVASGSGPATTSVDERSGTDAGPTATAGDATADEGTPGFGVGIAVVALLTAALALDRR